MLGSKALLVLVFCLSQSSAWADDALVLPTGVWRIYAVPVWSSVNASYDAEGNRHAIPEGSGRLDAFNLGWAVEFGVNSWLTAGVQWTPGANLSSSFDYPATDPARRDLANLDDSFDALAGVKIGIVGSTGRAPKRTTGLVLSDTLRVALGLAVKFPLTSIDWDREAGRYLEGRTYLAQAVDRHLVAPVVGLHLDWVLSRSPTKELFVDLYGQYVPYPSEARYADTSLARHLDPALSEVRIDYRHDLYLEAEPRYDVWVAPRVLRVGLYVPVRYRQFPATALDGVDQGNSGYRATVTPTLDFLSPVPGFPVELKIGWQKTIAGRNAAATDALIIVLRAMP